MGGGVSVELVKLGWRSDELLGETSNDVLALVVCSDVEFVSLSKWKNESEGGWPGRGWLELTPARCTNRSKHSSL